MTRNSPTKQTAMLNGSRTDGDVSEAVAMPIRGHPRAVTFFAVAFFGSTIYLLLTEFGLPGHYTWQGLLGARAPATPCPKRHWEHRRP
jgi:hypothetical protein